MPSLGMRKTPQLILRDAMIRGHRVFYAQNKEGEFLSMLGEGFTSNLFWAWKGSGPQFKKLNESRGGDLIPVHVNEVENV